MAPDYRRNAVRSRGYTGAAVAPPLLRRPGWCILGAIALSAAAAAAQDPAYADAAARATIERARAAVVHRGTLADVRSLILKGRLRVPTETAEPRDGAVAIKILLPDRYLRVDTLEGVERRMGIAGSNVLTPDGSAAEERARFARVLLGMLAYAPPDAKLRVQSTGESAFADTEAVDLTGPAFTARLVLDAATHVPMRIVFFGDRQVSTVVSFANRRTVDGLELPFRVTTQTPDRVLETLMFDEVLVNPPLAEDEFRR
jgi:hypothetical protein